jgi:hypothetical protein
VNVIKQLFHWLQRVGLWLWSWDKAWLTLLAVPVAFLLGWWLTLVFLPLPTWESVFRYAGLALELAGVGTVARGLYETRRQFGKPGLGELLIQKIKAFPRFRSPIHLAAGELVSANATCDAVITTDKLAPKPGTPLEERVAILEKAVNEVNAQVVVVQHEIRQESKNRASAIAIEKTERERGDENLQKALDEAVSGGIYLEAIGLFWLVCGVILATASPEISAPVTGFLGIEHWLPQ